MPVPAIQHLSADQPRQVVLRELHTRDRFYKVAFHLDDDRHAHERWTTDWEEVRELVTDRLKGFLNNIN